MRVLPLMTLQPLPKATARLCGLMNLQGESIPVVNVTNLLGQERQESYTIDTPILLCKYGDRKTALLVDEVVGIEEYKDSDLQRTETVTQKTLPVSGVLITSLGPTYILDIERIINFDYYSAPEAPDPQKLI